MTDNDASVLVGRAILVLRRKAADQKRGNKMMLRKLAGILHSWVKDVEIEEKIAAEQAARKGKG